MSSVGKKEIATKKSGHGAVAPGAISPVSPPAPPVPTPFVYTARTANKSGTEHNSSYWIWDTQALVEGSQMDVDPPANAPSKTAGGDLVTHADTKIAVMRTGSMVVKAAGKNVCGTGDLVNMNVLTAQQQIAQMVVPLLNKVDFARASKSAAKAHAVNEEYYRAFHPERANQTNVGDPIDVGTGFVVDDGTDLTLPGPIELVWRRTYSSGYHKRRTTALGKGGWIHSFEQWVQPGEQVIRLHDDEGLPVDFAVPAPDEVSFHRGRRLELRAAGKRYLIRSLDDRLVREFSALPDGRFALASITDPYGHRIELEYSGSVLVRISDSCGREVRVMSDERGRVVRVEVWARAPGSEEAPALQTWFDYDYHVEGTLASHTNALSHIKRWEYDGLHRMVKTTARNGISFQYEYDEETGRCVRTWGDGGLHDVRLTTDDDTGEVRTHGTSRARRYHVKDGIVLREETFDGGWASERGRDEDGLLIRRGNAAGEAMEYAYDARGNLVKETDPAGNVTAWEIEGDAPVRRVDAAGLETRYQYDARGALVSVTLPTGASFSLARDTDGRVAGAFGPNGALATFTYDEHGNVASETSGRGETTWFRHDALGRPVARVEASGHVTHTEHDRLGQVLARVRADGTRLAMTYDPVGNVTSTTDAAGRTTRFEYSGTGHLAKIVPPDGQVVALLHDADERPVEIINALLERYRLEYDRADRVVAERTFDGRLITYRRDRGGRVTRIDHPDGEWREFAYDKLGNLVEDRGPDVQITFERDALGRIVRAVCTDATAKVVTEFERDRLGQVIAERQDGRTVRYEYDACGRRTARVAPGGERTEYRHDDDDLLVGITHEGRAVSIQRDGEGRERLRDFGAWRLEQDHDVLGRLVQQQVISAGAAGAARLAVRRRYGHDTAGRLTSVSDGPDGPGGTTTTYRYDRADQLLEAASGKRREVFAYDPTGSLVGAVRGVGSPDLAQRWSLGPGNVLRAAGNARYLHDGRGRRIQRIEKGGAGGGGEKVTIYGWDTKDRLREVVLPDGRRVRFTYDAFGRRVRKTVLSAWDGAALDAALAGGASGGAPVEASVDYLWDGDVVCEERHVSAQGERARVHVHDPGSFTPLLQVEQGTVFGVIVNQVGTPTELVDERGRIAWRAQHGAWGDVVSVERDPHTLPVESPFRLLGQVADDETGLCSTRFRYFEPACGRWLSPDPINVHGGLNLMAFGGAPTQTWDPLGLAYDPWQPHSAGTSDWNDGKGTHFYTGNPGVELGVRTDGRGNVTFERVTGTERRPGPVQDQINAANQRLRTDASWRWQLLRNLTEGIQRASTGTPSDRALAARMEQVRAALARLIAHKGH
ncbi:DUF6531 domain-containing protein [Sorangium sp. So ce590]|uniref:DUF6531 domain-containing protein n=1 Tax=Sorangium sp. So ce590 TaxID=3133317 RepID=UPI003F600358